MSWSNPRAAQVAHRVQPLAPVVDCEIAAVGHLKLRRPKWPINP